MIRDIEVGMKIGVARAGIESVGEREIDFYDYTSQIVEINDMEWLILGPIKKGMYAYFPRGSRILISAKSEIRGEIFSEFLIKETIKDNGYMLLVERISGFKSRQNRNSFRMGCSLPIKLICHSEGKEKAEDTETIDISAGGVKVFSNLTFSEGDELDCEIDLGESKVVSKLKVVRKLDNKSVRHKFQYALIFEGLTELQEDIIVKYLFEYHRHLIAEGRADD